METSHDSEMWHRALWQNFTTIRMTVMPRPQESSAQNMFRLRHIPDDSKLHKQYRQTSNILDIYYCETGCIIYFNLVLQRDMSKYHGTFHPRCSYS
jgi:hypothetical protein